VYKVSIVDSRTHAMHTSEFLRFKDFREVAMEAGSFGVFPKTYPKSKFGGKLTDEELADRLEGLNSWIREVVQTLQSRTSTDDDVGVVGMKRVVGWSEMEGRGRRRSSAGRRITRLVRDKVTPRNASEGESSSGGGSHKSVGKKANGLLRLVGMLTGKKLMKTTTAAQ
jgi:hypothetical protein